MIRDILTRQVADAITAAQAAGVLCGRAAHGGGGNGTGIWWINQTMGCNRGIQRADNHPWLHHGA